MDDDVLGGYREAAPPKAERFPLRMGAGARLSMLVSLGGIAFTVLFWVFTGQLLLLFVAVLGPGLLYLVSGVPRVLEVRHDAVVIHSWLRAPRAWPAAELAVRVSDDSLVLESGEARLSIAAEHFPEGSLERCVAAMRARDVAVRDERLF